MRSFIDAHESVFVVEQNRDGQMRTLLINEFGIDPARLVAVLHYDGTPITARFIADAVAAPHPARSKQRQGRLTMYTQSPTRDTPRTVDSEQARIHRPTSCWPDTVMARRSTSAGSN